MRACDAGEGSAYLVRPDGHVCARWKQVTPQKVRAALDRVLAKSEGN